MSETRGTVAEVEQVLRDAPYPVPSETEFGEDGFLEAPHLEGVAEALIDGHGLDASKATKVVYLWRAKGGASQGSATWGKCQKPSGLLRYFSEAEFVVWLAADHLRDARASRRQVEAVLHHELLHIAESTQEGHEGELILRNHEFAGFRDELRLYADVMDELRAVVREAQQLPLFDPTEAGVGR